MIASYRYMDSESAQLGPSQVNLVLADYCSQPMIASRVESSQRHHGKHAL